MVPGSVEALEKPDKSSGLKRHEKSFESFDGLRTREAYVNVMKKKCTKFCIFFFLVSKNLLFGSFAYLFHKNVKLKSNFFIYLYL